MLIVFSLKEKEVDFSEFELQRRIDAGDKRAEKMLNKKKFAPVYNYFLRYFGCALMILSVVLFAKVVDFYQATLIIFVVFLVSKGILKSGVLSNISSKINRKTIPIFGGIYFAQNLRIQNRLSKMANKKQPWAFYSKEELLHFLEKHRQILDKNEQKWIEKIFELKEGRALDEGISSEKMAIIHANDLLTPLIIDELFKTKQNIFPVMDSEETSVKGVIFLEDITKIDSSDSKKAQKVMREDFFSLKSDISALDAFEKMISKDKNYAILLEKNGDLAGIVNLTDFIRKK
ncbi:MAG: CBS domain-containing protein [Candidatus Nanogingivalaceae bacterium]|nr:MAG: CBS domain-containing protein [Candidatus Nanogingivalaceae bacterium]